MKTILKITTLLIISILLGTSTFAQYGPGGVGNKDGSADQPETKFWFDASYLNYTNGQKVSVWPDRSYNANDAEQIVANNQPTFYNENQLGYNFPVVYFDASNENFMPFDGNQIAGKDYTIFIVAQRRTTTSRQYFFAGTDAGTNKNLHVFWGGSSNFQTHHYGNDLSVPLLSNSLDYSGGTDESTFGIFTTRLASSQAQPYRRNFQNNKFINQSFANSSSLISWNGAAMARAAFNNTPVYSQIDIAEMIVYGSALNQAQIEIVNNYLSEKYNITIDNDLYTPPTDCKLNVSGIGNRNYEKHCCGGTKGMGIFETANTLDNNEFVFISHTETINNEANINRSSQLDNCDAVAAWGREWYIDTIGTSEVDLKIVFSFPDAFENGLYPKNLDDYVLLWHSSLANKFEIINSPDIELITAEKLCFKLPASLYKEGYYTLGTKNESNSPLQGTPEHTWYALKSGLWNDWETWTTDPSGNLPNNPNHEIPSDNIIDKVVIHSGKSITVNINNINNTALTVQGAIDFGETTGHHFDEIKGSGRILLSNDNFPSGDASDFYSETLSKGTVIYYGTSDSLHIAREFYNLEIELNSETDTLTLLNDYTINGNLQIKKGVFKINHEDSTNIINIIVKKDLIIDAKGEIRTGKGKTIGSYAIGGSMPTSGNYHKIYHQLEIWGNFTNNGIVRFTNLSSPIYNQFAPNGVSVYFKGTNNTTALLNGQTDFYNLIVNKGTDQTYTLTINSATAENFKLFGANNVGRNESTPFSSSNPEVRKALWIYNGTLKLTGIMNIPTLSEGSISGGNGDYAIGQNAQLWLAGNITIYTTANDNSSSGNTQVDDASGTSVTTGGSNQALSVYGKFRISDGIFGTRNSAGFIFWASANAQVVIEGGELWTSQFRNSGLGIASYKQTGGKIYLEGNNNGGEFNGDYPIFGIDSESGVFQMSGGEIHIQDCDNDADPEFYIPSAEGNYLVTGGKLIFDLPNTSSAQIYSRANLWDLEINNSSLSGNMTLQLDSSISIKNDLVINNFTELDVQDALTSEAHNLKIGRNLSIEHDGIFTKRTSTTTFYGSENALLTFNNRYLATADDEEIFYRMVIEKPSDKKVSLASAKTGSALTGNNNNLLQINGPALIIKSGILDNGNYSVRLYTDSLVNYGTFGIYNESTATDDAKPNGNNDLIKFRPDNFVLLTKDNSKFGNIRLNNGDKIVELNSDVYMQRIEYRFGRINMKSHELKLDELFINLNSSSANYQSCGGCNSVEDMFISDGLASSKGLSLRISEIGTYTYPIGVGTSGIDTDPSPTSKYTPVELMVSNFIDTGYVRINPVNDTLRTTDHVNGDILKYYWSVSNSDFDNSPTVKYTMHYYDTDVLGSENLLVAGRVLSEAPYDRLYDDSNGKIDAANNTILFDLYEKGGSALTLENADYTAAKKNRFQGVVPTFYAVVNYGEWGNSNTWRVGAIDGTVKKVPSYGSIAIIPNTIRVSVKNSSGGIPEAPAEVRFEPNLVSNPNPNSEEVPRLQFYDPGTFDVGIVSGVGMVSFNTASNPNVIADFGKFGTNPLSFFMYWGGNATLNNIPTPIPSLMLESSTLTIGQEIEVGQNLIMTGNATCIPTKDITVGKDLFVGAWNGGTFQFPASGNAITLTINGNIDYTYVENNGTRRIKVEDAASNLIHKLIVKGNIIQGASDLFSLELYKSATRPKVILELQETGNNQYTRNSTAIPSLYRIVMNKDTSQANSFSFNENFSLFGESQNLEKAIELLNGTLILNHPDINIDLSSGNYNFEIPETAALKILQGTANVYGDNTGIRLSGKLSINGGNLILNGSGNGNNFIEYTTSGKAEIEITAGNFEVGGQIRRALNTEEGILKYNQTGGTVEIGTAYPAENKRAVFEILNSGSSFTFTGGSFKLAQSQTSPSIASFYFAPTNSTITAGNNIIFGTLNSNISRKQFSIYSTKSLQSIELNNESGVNPKLSIWTLPLTLAKDLVIDENAEFDANGMQLNIAGNFVNNGIFTANNNLTNFNGSSTQEISGNSITEFYKLTKSNTNTLNLANRIIVNNEFRLEKGILADNSHRVYAKGNVYNNAVHEFGGEDDGIQMCGSIRQHISGSGYFGRLCINNFKGVELGVGDNITINNDLEFETGVLYIGGSLLTIAKYAQVVPENPFSAKNMIETNASFTDNGVKKFFPSGSGFFIFPIGSGGKYTPIKVYAHENIDEDGYLTVKAANERHPSIVEDSEAPENIEIPDSLNVLKYYWTLKARNFNDATGIVEFYFDRADIQATNGYDSTDYIAARLLENSTFWNKYEWSDFNMVEDEIIFKFDHVSDDDISGDYTAGVQPDSGLLKGAIPENVIIYQTVASGNWSDGTIWSPQVHGGPHGSIAIINQEHTVTADMNYILSHHTEIYGTLNTENTFGNRLGLVTGTGTLSTESGLLPAGFYNSFLTKTTGGTLEYKGNTDYYSLNNLPEVNNLIFSGSGIRNLPNLNLSILGNLTINGDDASLQVINTYNKKISLYGNFILGTGQFIAGTGDDAIVELAGDSPQTISGDFTGTNTFNHLTMNNLSGVNITSNIEIANNLTFENGVISMLGSKKLTLKSLDENIVSGYSCSKYISGIVVKQINDNEGFLFPIGKAGRCGFAEILNTHTSGAQYWEAEYFNQTASSAGLSTEQFLAPITFISESEYWRIKSNEEGSDAEIRLFWDDLSGFPSETSEIEKQKIAQWKDNSPATSQWEAISVVGGIDESGKSIISSISPTYNELTNGNYYTFATITNLTTLSWVGSVSSEWENPNNWDAILTPYSASDVIIPDIKLIDTDYFFPEISSEASCKNLQIDENASLIVKPSYSLQLNGDFEINGTFVLAALYEESASLLNFGTITTGANADIRIYRWAPANKYSYISSPLTLAVRDSFNTRFGTNPNFYKYVESNDDLNNNWMYAWKFGDEILTQAKGYASGWPGRGNHLRFQGGTLNNGDISIEVTNSAQNEKSNGWNLIGNPYPCALDAELFVTENAGKINGALYFWDDDGSLGDDYSPSDYATWNLAGSVSGQASPESTGSHKIPDGFIGMGQGFFVHVDSSGTIPVPVSHSLTFTNNMKTFGNGQFFNTKKNNKTNIQRIKLSLQNAEYYNECLVAFAEEASDGIDNLYDAPKMQSNANLNFYSLIENKPYSIQTFKKKSLLENQKNIDLGFTVAKAGNYSICLREVENIESSNFIYLKDKESDILINLSTDSLFSFYANAGENNTRFELIFSNIMLSDKNENEQSNIEIYSVKKHLIIKLDEWQNNYGRIEICNLNGQKIKQIPIENENSFNIPLSINNGIYIIKVICNQNTTTRKLFFDN